MRLKFSPRQRVVSLALAILAVGVVATLGYRSLGNIFASTTQRQKVTIALSNWDKTGEALFYSSFGTNTQFRCSTVTIYVDDKSEATIKKAVNDIVAYNSPNLTSGQDSLTQTINQLMKAGKESALNVINKTVITNSVYNNGALKSACDRGVTATNKIQLSKDYDTGIKIPTSYQTASYVNISGENTTSPTAEKSVAPTASGSASAVANGNSNVLDETAFDQISYGDKVCINSGSWKTTYTKIQGTDTTGNNSSEYGYKAFQKTKDYSGSGAPNIIYQNDNTTYKRTGYVGKNWAYSKGECTASSTTSAVADSSGIALSVTVKNNEGTAIKDSRITIKRLDSSGNTIAGVSTQYLTTDENGAANDKIATDGLYSENIVTLRITVEKFDVSETMDYAWANLSNKLSLNFRLDVTDEKAKQEQTAWTAAATDPGEDNPEFDAATQIDTDSNWPGGNNTLELIAVRRSMYNSSYNGYTPVGSVEYEINIYTTATTTDKKTSLNLLGTDKARAADPVASAQASSSASPIAQPSASSTIGVAVKNIPNDILNDITGGPVPYDQNKVAQYTSDSLKTLRDSYSYASVVSTKGRIADNGINSEVKISNLPPGIYDIKLTKYNFTTSRFLYIMGNGTNEKLVLPIAPNTYAEPPSISSGTIEKIPNQDIYKADGYIYISKYPWFGWQKESEYITDKPAINNGVPAAVTASGEIIQGAGGNTDLQKCIENKQKSLGISASGLSMKDALLGTAGAYLLKQSAKQNNNLTQGAMVAAGIASLFELARSSDATVSINYDIYNCVESVYGASYIPSSCRGCFNVTGVISGTSDCNANCLLQYGPLINTLSNLSLIN